MKVYFEDVEETMLSRRERKKRREHKKWAANFYNFTADNSNDDAEEIYMQVSERRAHRKLRDQRRAKIEQFD